MNADGRVIKVKSEMNKRMMQHLCHNGLLNSNQFAHRSVRMHEVQDAFGESGSEAGRFRGPSGRAPFSDEGGFTFSEASFEGTLHEGLKGASPSEGGA